MKIVSASEYIDADEYRGWRGTNTLLFKLFTHLLIGSPTNLGMTLWRNRHHTVRAPNVLRTHMNAKFLARKSHNPGFYNNIILTLFADDHSSKFWQHCDCLCRVEPWPVIWSFLAYVPRQRVICIIAKYWLYLCSLHVIEILATHMYV